jgi:hypothetical protein
VDSVILTSYFSVKKHPNDPNDSWVIGREADGRVSQNDFKYIEPWYNSINKLGLEGRIFYDNLSDEFVQKYSTDKIKFVRVETSQYSNLDWRWFCYRNYLEENKFDNVFLTDGSDVAVVKNPSKIILDYNDIDLFVCKDSIKLSQFPYIQVHQQANWENLGWFLICQNNADLINMGVVGGTYNNILEFLNKFCETRIRLGNPDFGSADMWVGQYVFRHLLSDKNIMIGEPFTSNFKQYEIDRKDVYFIHK